MGDIDASTTDEVSDRELMARHVAGDSEAFGEIFRRHRDRLWAVALRTLTNPDDAADALQDAMISAFRRAESYRGDAAVTTWLHRIVVNACLDRVRREAVRAADPLPEDDRSTQLATRRDEVGERETSIDVTAALATLPVDQRAALVLVDMAGYSVQDAADILEVAPGTIKSRCARGRARLLPLVRTSSETGPPDPSGARPARSKDPVLDDRGGNQTRARGVGPETQSAQQPSNHAGTASGDVSPRGAAATRTGSNGTQPGAATTDGEGGDER